MSERASHSFLGSIKKAARIGGTALTLGIVSTPVAVGTYFSYDIYTHGRNIPAPTEQDYKDAKERVLQYESGFGPSPREYAFGKPLPEPNPNNFINPELQKAYVVIDQQDYYHQHHVSDTMLTALGGALVLSELAIVGLFIEARLSRRNSMLDNSALQTNTSY